LTSRLESTAQQFSQSDFQSIRDKSQGMKLLAEEVRQEIDMQVDRLLGNPVSIQRQWRKLYEEF
jgi:hypothetical protein